MRPRPGHAPAGDRYTDFMAGLAPAIYICGASLPFLKGSL
jgi:hypothetical protein